ncbi:hypothetical protein FQA47_019294 [Oryzias melastigma]|uniref:Uncharacterized protein n=1 Tax=Oryzias melastigma TaxID=30732 RepID=A0A834F2A6_ORYME|nr:hypothetical protein FQA47_019294 [Oryzias melastigma]
MTYISLEMACVGVNFLTEEGFYVLKRLTPAEVFQIICDLPDEPTEIRLAELKSELSPERLDKAVDSIIQEVYDDEDKSKDPFQADESRYIRKYTWKKQKAPREPVNRAALRSSAAGRAYRDSLKKCAIEAGDDVTQPELELLTHQEPLQEPKAAPITQCPARGAPRPLQCHQRISQEEAVGRITSDTSFPRFWLIMARCFS